MRAVFAYGGTWEGFVDRVRAYREHLQAHKLIVASGLLNVPIAVELGDYLDDESASYSCLLFSALPGQLPPHAPGLLVPDVHYVQHRGYAARFEQIDRMRDRFPWSRKVPKAFWRGSSTWQQSDILCDGDGNSMHPRERLCEIALRHPDLLDCKISNYVGDVTPNPAHLGRYVDIVSQLQFQLLIDIDGFSNAWDALAWKLYSGCVVLKVHSDYAQWFYAKMVPVRRDMSDLVQQVGWCLAHPSECCIMAENARQLAVQVFSQVSTHKALLEALVAYKSKGQPCSL